MIRGTCTTIESFEKNSIALFKDVGKVNKFKSIYIRELSAPKFVEGYISILMLFGWRALKTISPLLRSTRLFCNTAIPQKPQTPSQQLPLDAQQSAQRALLSQLIINCIDESQYPPVQTKLNDWKTLAQKCKQVSITNLYGMQQNSDAKKWIEDMFTQGSGIKIPGYLSNQERVTIARENNRKVGDQSIVFFPSVNITKPVMRQCISPTTLMIAGSYGISKTFSIILYTVLSNTTQEFCEKYSHLSKAKQIIQDSGLNMIPKMLYYSLNKEDDSTPQGAMDELKQQMPAILVKQLEGVYDYGLFFDIIGNYYKSKGQQARMTFDQINSYFHWVNDLKKLQDMPQKSLENKQRLDILRITKKICRWTPFLQALLGCKIIFKKYNNSVNVQFHLDQYCLKKNFFTFQQSSHTRVWIETINHVQLITENELYRKEISTNLWFSLLSRINRFTKPGSSRLQTLKKAVMNHMDNYKWPVYSNFLHIYRITSRLSQSSIKQCLQEQGKVAAVLEDLLNNIKLSAWQEMVLRANKFVKESPSNVFGTLQVFMAMLSYISLQNIKNLTNQTGELPLKIPISQIVDYSLYQLTPQRLKYILNQDFFSIRRNDLGHVYVYLSISEILKAMFTSLETAAGVWSQHPELIDKKQLGLHGVIVERVIVLELIAEVIKKISLKVNDQNSLRDILCDQVVKFPHMPTFGQLTNWYTFQKNTKALFDRAREKGYAIGIPHIQLGHQEEKLSPNNACFDLIYVKHDREDMFTIYPIDMAYCFDVDRLRNKARILYKTFVSGEKWQDPNMMKEHENNIKEPQKKPRQKKHVQYLRLTQQLSIKNQVVPVVMCPLSMIKKTREGLDKQSEQGKPQKSDDQKVYSKVEFWNIDQLTIVSDPLKDAAKGQFSLIRAYRNALTKLQQIAPLHQLYRQFKQKEQQ